MKKTIILCIIMFYTLHANANSTEMDCAFLDVMSEIKVNTLTKPRLHATSLLSVGIQDKPSILEYSDASLSQSINVGLTQSLLANNKADLIRSISSQECLFKQKTAEITLLINKIKDATKSTTSSKSIAMLDDAYKKTLATEQYVKKRVEANSLKVYELEKVQQLKQSIHELIINNKNKPIQPHSHNILMVKRLLQELNIVNANVYRAEVKLASLEKQDLTFSAGVQSDVRDNFAVYVKVDLSRSWGYNNMKKLESDYLKTSFATENNEYTEFLNKVNVDITNEVVAKKSLIISLYDARDAKIKLINKVKVSNSVEAKLLIKKLEIENLVILSRIQKSKDNINNLEKIISF